MIDTRAISEAGVALAITPGAVRRPVAESVIALVFALATNLTQQERVLRGGGWRGALPRLGCNIQGRVLGSLGLGNIAREVFRMAQSLGFRRLIAHDPFVGEETARALNVELVAIDELFRQSDFLTVNVPLSEDTRGLVGEALIARMKPEAFLINTARGPIVDELALERALRERRIAGAGLDVFEVEPLPPASGLRELDNVIMTPHGLAWTNELARDNSIEACDNILAVSRGDVPVSVVNRDVVSHPRFQARLSEFRSRT
jgi:phosphoglycerate dehydrogenase-like enzyme